MAQRYIISLSLKGVFFYLVILFALVMTSHNIIDFTVVSGFIVH